MPIWIQSAKGFNLLTLLSFWILTIPGSVLVAQIPDHLSSSKPSILYFPPGTVSDFEQGWYAEQLLAMKEPVLPKAGKNDQYTVIRILYLPTFGPSVAVRYEANGEHLLMRSVQLSGMGGYEPGHIKTEKLSAISSLAMHNILVKLKETGFWSLPTQDGVKGCDGSELIIEAIQDGQYHIVTRWTPEVESTDRGLVKLVAFYTHEFETAGFWDHSK